MAPMRLTGLATGLDTDKVIQDLMKAERFRVNKIEKEKIRTEWIQTAMRDLIGKTRDFQSKYFDSLKPESHMLSSSPFSSFEYSVTSMGVPTNAVQISVRGDAPQKDNIIHSISQLASADSWKSGKVGLSIIRSENEIDLAAMKAAGTDLEFALAIGKTAKRIQISKNELDAMSSVGDLASKINEKIAGQFGSDFSSIVSAVDIGTGKGLEFNHSGSVVRFLGVADNDLFTKLNISNGSSTHSYRNKSLAQLFGLTSADLENFSLNGKTVEISANMTLDKVLRKINGAEAGISLYYDSLADRFVMESSKTGSANDIRIADGSSAEKLLSKLFGVSDLVDAQGELTAEASATASRQKGMNAKLNLNGSDLVMDSNQFSIEGVNYTLNSTSASEIKVSAKVNADQIYDRIKSFVDDYNTLIDEIDKKVTEERFRKYEPLTEEEKDAVTEKQAEKLEEKAKSGILNGNNDLRRMLDKLRLIMVDDVDGSYLRSIGIMSNSYRDKGKLSIDAGKLKHAIKTDLEGVINIFTKQSDVLYTDEAKRGQRYQENGVAARLNDVIRDYTRTTRDSKGNKGFLVSFAGLENDSSVKENRLSKMIKQKEDRMEQMKKFLEKKEDYYYRMFAQMEAAMSKMQSQQSSMMGLFNGMMNNGQR